MPGLSLNSGGDLGKLRKGGGVFGKLHAGVCNKICGNDFLLATITGRSQGAYWWDRSRLYKNDVVKICF